MRILTTPVGIGSAIRGLAGVFVHAPPDAAGTETASVAAERDDPAPGPSPLGRWLPLQRLLALVASSRKVARAAGASAAKMVGLACTLKPPRKPPRTRARK